MDIQALHRSFENCACGRVHSCPVEFVEIGHGATVKIAEVCRDYKKILLVSDENTYKACGKSVSDLLSEKVEKNLILRSDGKVVIPDEEKISEIEAAITKETDFVVGVGSGVINDLCKYVSFKNNLRYCIVATAPSMDGYASVGSALILEGMKVTLNARPPMAIIADTEVLKDASFDMIQAGYGDIIGKFSCLNDWKLSTLINGEYFCEAVYNLTEDCTKRVVKMAEGIVARDEDTIGALMEALVTVGVAMSYVGNSRPASGSEHHLSHFFEITGILDNKEYFAHGIDVAFSAVKTAKIREGLLSRTPCHNAFVRSEWENEIRRIYSTSADGVIALQDKLGWYMRDDEKVVLDKWEEIRAVLKESPSPSEFEKMLSKVGLDFADFKKLYGEDKIKDARRYAKDLKDRYTVLWLDYCYF